MKKSLPYAFDIGRGLFSCAFIIGFRRGENKIKKFGIINVYILREEKSRSHA